MVPFGGAGAHGQNDHYARQQKEGGITTSKLVPDARTTMTLRDLTSEFEWDRVLYSWYGRARYNDDTWVWMQRGKALMNLRKHTSI